MRLDRCRRYLPVAAVGTAMMCWMAGCGGGIPIVSDKKTEYDYPKAQAMIIIANERNRYEHAYTEQIWDVEVEDGKTFEAYLLEQIQGFLKDLKTMNLLADSRALEISNAEQEQIRKVAEAYYQGLTEADIQYMGVTQKDVEAMYEEYYTANKLVSQLTEEMDLEVSDSEAKVISVRQAVFADREQAAEVVAALAENGSDFTAVVKEKTDHAPEELQLGRGQVPEELEEAAFALEIGAISSVVESDGQYYIFQCVNDYEVEATKERKAQLYEERKSQAFGSIYAQFQTEHEVVLTDPLWMEIQFQESDQTTADHFFTLYQEELGGQSY